MNFVVQEYKNKCFLTNNKEWTHDVTEAQRFLAHEARQTAIALQQKFDRDEKEFLFFVNTTKGQQDGAKK